MSRISEQTYTVDIRYDEDRKIALREDWWKGGCRHRDGAPSYIVRDAKTGLVVREWWNQNGRTDRDGDLPAETKWDRETGVAVYEAYYFWNKLDRKTGPAVINRDPITGAEIRREWYHGGLLGRPDTAPHGPSLEVIDPTTRIVTREQYHFDGQLHRRDGPAIIERDAENGRTLITRYFLRDEELKSLPAFVAPPEL